MSFARCIKLSNRLRAPELIAVTALLGLAFLFAIQAAAQTPAPRSQAASPSATKATWLWEGSIYAQSSYSSQETDGSPGKHLWTREYDIALLEIPTTSQSSIEVNGQFVGWPVTNLVPVKLSYHVDAFTDDRPYVHGPAHGGHIASGTASGALDEQELVTRVGGEFQHAGATVGSLLPLEGRETSPRLPSTWCRLDEYGNSLAKAGATPGGYFIHVALSGKTAERTRELHRGITMSHVPSVIPELNRLEIEELNSPEGFVRRLELQPVQVFGFLQRPDQSLVSGAHTYSFEEAAPNYSPPQVVITWELKRTKFRPLVEVRYSQQPTGLIGPPSWQRHHEFVDFLVGHKQPAISVQMRTFPSEIPIEWSLAPRGQESGTINPASGRQKDFSFTPNVRNVRPTQGSRQPNRAIAYELTVRELGQTEVLARETIRQDTISVLRQEYVDYRRETDARNVRFGLVPPSRERCGPIPSFSGSFTFTEGRDVVFGNYLTLNCTLNGGWQQLAFNTQADYGGVIDINSAYRNPQRNTAVNGAALSIHMTGGAVDMDMEPQTPEQLVLLHRSVLRASGGSEKLLERAGGRAGGRVLFPRNWGPPPATHTFTVGTASVIVEDSDADDLPDRVAEIIGEPRAGLPSTTMLRWNGNGASNPSFQIDDGDGDNRIDPGESLVLLYPVRPAIQRHPLRHYYEIATHVHCATAELAVEQAP